MGGLIAFVCASVFFVRSGHIPDPYPQLDFYWMDYEYEEQIRRTYAISIAQSPECANLVSPGADMRDLPRCDTFIWIGTELTGALAMSKILQDYRELNVVGLPYCEAE